MRVALPYNILSAFQCLQQPVTGFLAQKKHWRSNPTTICCRKKCPVVKLSLEGQVPRQYITCNNMQQVDCRRPPGVAVERMVHQKHRRSSLMQAL